MSFAVSRCAIFEAEVGDRAHGPCVPTSPRFPHCSLEGAARVSPCPQRSRPPVSSQQRRQTLGRFSAFAARNATRCPTLCHWSAATVESTQRRHPISSRARTSTTDACAMLCRRRVLVATRLAMQQRAGLSDPLLARARAHITSVACGRAGVRTLALAPTGDQSSRRLVVLPAFSDTYVRSHVSSSIRLAHFGGPSCALWSGRIFEQCAISSLGG